MNVKRKTKDRKTRIAAMKEEEFGIITLDSKIFNLYFSIHHEHIMGVSSSLLHIFSMSHMKVVSVFIYIMRCSYCFLLPTLFPHSLNDLDMLVITIQVVYLEHESVLSRLSMDMWRCFLMGNACSALSSILSN